MTLRTAMVQAARRASRQLDAAAPRVAEFVAAQHCAGGGFRGRGGAPDLYYTMFAVMALRALDAPLPSSDLGRFVETCGEAEELDLVHLGCAARIRAELERPYGDQDRHCVLARVAAHRSHDGGYSTVAGAESGTAYGVFVALGLLEDLDAPLPTPGELSRALETLRSADGGYGNSAGQERGVTPATAAAVTVLARLGETVDRRAVEWLGDRRGRDGGFGAVPGAPFSDLLSTATALHALRAVREPLEALREECLDFLDSLWRARGGFCGSSIDPVLDCEYTFYGLLALGHVAQG